MSVKSFADYGIHVNHSAGEEKTVCPECSTHRKKKTAKCLNVNHDKRVWNCWHCGWRGGLSDGVYERATIRKTYVRPDYVANSTGLPDKVLAWFSGRGITQAALKRNKVGYGTVWMPQVEGETTAIQFPYFRGAECINIKYRDGHKNFRMASGAERILYGVNDINYTLVWVEGEIDKLSVEVAGIRSCVSVPDGAPAENSKNYENKFDFLSDPALVDVATHIIAVDSDAPGTRLKDELIRRLGAEKCKTVTWPEDCKDANEVLVKHGLDALAKCIANAQPIPITGAYGVEDFATEFDAIYRNGSPKGLPTGWREVDELFSLRVGDMTIVTGIPNSGKSEWIDAVMVNTAHNYGWPWGVFSAENWPVTEHMKKLSEKYIGKPFEPGRTERMTPQEKDAALSWMANKFFFVQPESPTLESILSIVRQLVLRRGIRGLVIDPWNEIEHSRPEAMSETEYIGSALSEIRRFARLHGLHVFVVAHPTKLRKGDDGNYPVPTPYDISGSANWRNKADNCISIWRDLGKTDSRMVDIHIQKIRHKTVGKLGSASLRYDTVCGRYHGAEPMRAPAMDRNTVSAGEHEYVVFK